ncbi:AcrR family transcriptional regulator [Saccharomonospora amisosensis]|uniref:AcrR family transcriptional regulator n=1 Tax=Saccharomonospora amisosensis TaxID=1128677 RepID=A0A7X5UQR1_9PSEU|nr:TetR/AcrR family transcriptional regulator [Saccharomonospora amisosensis]NIJ12471.1 AcrR family transcriptional regulator [Saccharomonospora amisosensis]
MSTSRAASLPHQKRDRLLRTAAREFASVGYERASLNRIIRACGMSKSSFYHYLDSKQQLFELVVEELSDSLLRQLGVPDPQEFADDFWRNARRLLTRLADIAEREPLFTDVGRMFYLPKAPTGKGTAVDGAVAAAERWLDRALEAGRGNGAVRDDLPLDLQRHLAFAVLRAFDEWTLRHLADLDSAESERLMLAQFGTLRRLLAPLQEPEEGE